MSRIAYKLASPRDVSALGKACANLPGVKKALEGYKSPLIKRLSENISAHEDISDLVERALAEELPLKTEKRGVPE